MTPRPRSVTHGFTITEMVFFGAIATVVLITMIGLLARGSKIFELGRQASSAQNDLRVLLEYMAEDAAELTYIDKQLVPTGEEEDIILYTKSSRPERGLSGSDQRSDRKIVYRLEPAGPNRGKKCIREVTLLDSSGNQGASFARPLVEADMVHLKVWAICAVPNSGGTAPYYKLKPASTSDAEIQEKGTSVACLIVDAAAGQARGKTSLDEQPVSEIVTRLWCRNRILEISRGALR